MIDFIFLINAMYVFCLCINNKMGFARLLYVVYFACGGRHLGSEASRVHFQPVALWDMKRTELPLRAKMNTGVIQAVTAPKSPPAESPSVSYGRPFGTVRKVPKPRHFGKRFT
jgi:hypothetical protein